MASYAYEVLSMRDGAFLVFEAAHAHMHHGGIAIFDASALRTKAAGIDVGRIRRHIAARLGYADRYRQRLAFVPMINAPVWVDDQHFNLLYHVRHTALPRPGNEPQLKEECARIMSQQLDRGKPLWEMWIVEGLENDRFALMFKTHHSMADGVSAVGFLALLLNPTPDATVEAPAAWKPRPPPSPRQLLRDTLVRRLRMPFDLGRELGAALLEPRRMGPRLIENLSAVSKLVGTGISPPTDTPLNRPIGPHRRLDWLTLDLGAVKGVKNRFGVTLNDVVLATVAGAVRLFLKRRRVTPEGLDFRAVVPVNLRSEVPRGALGNHVSAWLTALPVGEPDPRRRLIQVSEETRRLKESKQELAAAVLGRVAEMAGPALLTVGIRLAARMHPYNLIVTNVPGPPMPLYLLGARMLEGYPLVPLFENQGLGVALCSYEERLCWGFNADFDVLPDLDAFIDGVRASFAELYTAAGLARSPALSTGGPEPTATPRGTEVAEEGGTS
jgi:WS/DGAT/MGAT family acyltransferase